jgi:two-component system NtrC family sensor kinase
VNDPSRASSFAPGRVAGDWARTALPVGVALALLALGVVNVATRALTTDVEDGVLWVQRTTGIVAAEVGQGTPAARAGVAPGDVLLAIDGHPVEAREDVLAVQRSGAAGDAHTYTVLRLGSREVRQIALAPIPRGLGAFYYVLAAVGIFSLLVGATVRVRRPHDQATLHFFWLTVAFFGVFTFSFSGRLDRVDWFFYWADQVATLLLPPLFVHFALAFPERPRSDDRCRLVARLVPALYVAPLVLGGLRVLAISRASSDPERLISLIARLDRIEPLYLAAYLLGGVAVLAVALVRVRSVTAMRQLRWIMWGTAIGAAPFALGYALPFALGIEPSLPMQLSAIPLGFIPLAFASAIVRYRLMDVEVILKRLLVYGAALAAIAAIYGVILRTSGRYLVQTEDEHRWMIAFLATVIVLLLARPVKDAVQAAIDRAFYRDRYDYRRALVAFARDLNSDLDLERLADHLVTRVKDTLVVDRMAMLLADDRGGFEPIRHVGFDHTPPGLTAVCGLSSRLGDGHTVRLDDPLAVGRFTAEEVEYWRDLGLYYFVPCTSKGATTAVLALGRRDSGDPLTTEDLALMAAVAGQAATAIENGRLYRQLQAKATEFDRLRGFNEHILESLEDGLMVIGRDGRIVLWNRALERLYGLTRHEAIGRTLEELFDAEVVQVARNQAAPGDPIYRLPLVARGTRAGERILVNVATVPLQPLPGQPWSGTIAILEDVTERAQLEEQLRLSEKMASLGLLAAGVAHEVNTPLTGISSYTQMLLEQADPDDPRTAVLEKIEKQTFRAARIVNGLLTLSRPGAIDSGDRAEVDLNQVIADVLSLLEHQFEKGSVRIRRELSPTPVVVPAFEFKLQQVLLNLLLNARDAMPSGGWITLATRMEGGEAVAEVSDTGLGIPAEHIVRIYDPFFTTKAIGQGTGLGLSIAYGIVQEHAGTIHCESAPGQGTRFTLRLPATAAAETAAVPRQQSAGY